MVDNFEPGENKGMCLFIYKITLNLLFDILFNLCKKVVILKFFANNKENLI